MTEQPGQEPDENPATLTDPDGDPEMLNPRSTLGAAGGDEGGDPDADPDADPDMLSPRDDAPGA